MARRAALLLFCLAPVAAAGELSQEEWQRVRHEATALAAKPGEAERKHALVEAVAAEDSARTAHLLLEIASAAQERREAIERRLEKARSDFAKTNRRLRKKHGRKSSRKEFEKDPKWRGLRDAVARHEAEVEVEAGLLAAAGEALARVRAPAAVAVLVDTSDRAVVEARQLPVVRNAILEALWHQPAESVTDHVLAFAKEGDLPRARARVLHWIASHKVRKGWDVARAALRAKETAVVRSAVAALQSLDDPRCVPDLIRARGRATGLLAEELDFALHHFTGKAFSGVGADAMWKGWWRDEGEAWLKSVGAQRYDGADLPRKGNAAFYGIETSSNRIVFVLDRSGSMADPVPQGGGPSTGRPQAERVPGDTKIEVAKNQLARTIRKLAPDVRFAVVFYSHDVRVWKDPPTLLPASADNKRQAIDWFMDLKPVGSTMIFDALREALRYAEEKEGADTIFLLSDGAPSTPDGRELLTGPPLERAVKGFLDANRAFRCVVHTIGVGPKHNRALMQRLARETGGRYKAVGTR